MTTRLFTLRFKFKGDRDYVPGSDILKVFFSNIPNPEFITNIDATFHSLASTHLVAYKELQELNTGDIKSRINFQFKGNLQQYFIVENREPITGSYRYDENIISSACLYTQGSKSIKLNKKLIQFTSYEKIISMNKYLLNKIFPDAPGKWILTRIELENLPTDTNNIKIRLIKNFKLRLTKSEILIDNSKLGYVYFSIYN